MHKIDFDLYQVKSGDEYRDELFSNLSLLNRLGKKVDQAKYDKVYSGTVDAVTSNGIPKSTGMILESLFERFNLEFPADYRARSMSVSDVIVLHENGVDTAHFCDSIGFVEVPQFLLPAPSVNLETIGLTVDGHLGTWHTIDSRKIGGRDFFQIEHDEFGSTVANIVVDENGKPVAEDLWYGITPSIEKMILEEQKLSTSKPNTLQQEADSKTEEHTTNKSAKPENYLKNAEEYQEENYDCIDGRMSRQNKLTPGDDTETHPEQRPSILEKLHDKQAEISVCRKGPISTKEKSDDLSL